MRGIAGTFAVLTAVITATRLQAVEPLPEAEQAQRALKIIRDYDGTRPLTPPRQLRIVYFTPADREPVPGYEQRLEAIFENIRSFYRDEMERRGFGTETFTLERNSDGKLVFHLVKGKNSAQAYKSSWENRKRIIGGESRPVLESAGISPDHEVVAYICNLADWDDTAHTFRHPAPYTGNWDQQSGWCWLMDSPILNWDLILKPEPIVRDFQFGSVPMGKRTSMFVGSAAHELGHAFGLPHSGRRWDEMNSTNLGASLMGLGNLKYHDELRSEDRGASLLFASALRLASRSLFSGSIKGADTPPQLSKCELTLSTNVTTPAFAGRHGVLRVGGTVEGSPPVYGVVAYFDSLHDGGYRSPAATAVPDAQGRFALEVCELEPCSDGKLTIALCHANGAVSTRELAFTIPAAGKRSPQN